jgi:cellulose biosynthesis protein BcsQ
MGLSGILPRPRKRTSTSKGATLGQVIAFANQKGGVAKTTTTLNLAVAFKEHGFEVLIVDLDPQGNLTMSQGMDPDQVERSMYDVLVHSMPVEEVIHRAEVDVAVSSIDPRRRRARSVEHDRARARPAEGAAPGAQPL